MIAVRLIGGLGNQMFQYATGRALSVRHGVPFYLDRAAFETYTLHHYALHHLSITAHELPRRLYYSVSCRFSPLRMRQVQSALARRLSFQRLPQIVNEKGCHFDATLPENKPPIYLSGYWQSEKYFAAIADVIRRDFTIRTPPSPRTSELLQVIQKADSISMHLRRKDYVEHQLTNQVHGVCSQAYYAAAIQKMVAMTTKPHVFVFSDDPAWCREHVRLPCPSTFVDHNTAHTNYDDLRLMSACKHNIIANSSFSWWGAWLNPNPGKIVIAPARWYAHQDWVREDLLPADWHLIEA